MDTVLGLGLLFDIVVIGLLALAAFIGWKKGIIDMIGKTLFFVVVGVLTFVFKPLAVNIAAATPLPEVIGEKVSGTINGALGTRLSGGFTEESMAKLLSDGFLPDALAEKMAKKMADSGMLSGSVTELQNGLSKAITDFLVAAVAVIALFIVLTVIYIIVFKLLDLAAKLPVIKQANEGLGMAGGLLVMLVIIVITMWVLSLAAPFSTGVSSLLDGSYTYRLYMLIFG